MISGLLTLSLRKMRVLKNKRTWAYMTVASIIIFAIYRLNAAADHERAFRIRFSWLRTRALADYVLPGRATVILQPPSSKNNTSARPLLTIMVFSSPQHVHARHVLRATWARRQADVHVMFLCGVHASATVNTQLEREAAAFGDILQHNFVDHYANLTVKSVIMLKHLAAASIRRTPVGRYILKVDDDMFVHTSALLHVLRTCATRQAAMCGAHLPFCGGHVYRGVSADRQPASKWYLPPQLYINTNNEDDADDTAKDRLPDFVSGTAYVLSAAAVAPLYRAALRQAFVPLEDVFITGLAAQRAGVSRLHFPGFEKSRPLWLHACVIHGSLTVHGLTPREIGMLHDEEALPLAHDCDSLMWRVVRAAMIWRT